jgi:hypothetical protein
MEKGYSVESLNGIDDLRMEFLYTVYNRRVSRDFFGPRNVFFLIGPHRAAVF